MINRRYHCETADDSKEDQPMKVRGSDLLRDPRNVALLRLLRRDPRAAVADLGRGMGMSAPAVRERLQRLQDAGVVGWRVDIDPPALGFGGCALVRVRPS